MNWRERLNLWIEVRQDYKIVLDNPSPVIIDCGACIGISTMYFKKQYPNAEIHCFEPEPNNFKILQEITYPINDIIVWQRALSNKDGIVNITSNGSGSKITKGKGIKVEMIMLSDYIQEMKTIDLIKIDVEGSELEIMEDLRSSGAISKVKNFIIEVHHKPNNNLLTPILKILDDEDFSYWLKTHKPNHGGQAVIIKATKEE